MADHDHLPHYHAYLLRCWQERSRYGDRPALWRFSLEDPYTGVRHGFATLSALIAAVQHNLDNHEDEPASPSPDHDTAPDQVEEDRNL